MTQTLIKHPENNNGFSTNGKHIFNSLPLRGFSTKKRIEINAQRFGEKENDFSFHHSYAFSQGASWNLILQDLELLFHMISGVL
jgi:hypothetical protein